GASAILATAEIYDFNLDFFLPLEFTMLSPRTRFTGSLLLDGRVLLAGGTDDGSEALSSAELFDPGSLRFTATGPMEVPRVVQVSGTLTSGQVLVAGGAGEVGGDPLASAEVFDPDTGLFTLVDSLNKVRAAAVAVLAGGSALVVGGLDASGAGLADAES